MIPGRKTFQSPLHRGTGFNKRRTVQYTRRLEHFQSPLHRGTGFNVITGTLGDTILNFQSPLHRGTGFNINLDQIFGIHFESFSPLFIGAQVSTS